jgi:hypothetical protein
MARQDAAERKIEFKMPILDTRTETLEDKEMLEAIILVNKEKEITR